MASSRVVEKFALAKDKVLSVLIFSMAILLTSFNTLVIYCCARLGLCSSGMLPKIVYAILENPLTYPTN